MKIQILFSNLILILSLMACNKEDFNQEVYLGEIQFSFSIQNKNGDDLLDKSVSGTFNTPSISLYEKIDGKYVLYEDLNSAHPYGYKIIKHDGVYKFTPYYLGSPKLYTHDLKIDWGNGMIDYISVGLENGDGDTRIIQEILYNEDLTWIRTDQTSDIYFIVKID